MSKREEYGLEFRKISSNGKIGYNCKRKNGIVDENNLLQFISHLDRVNLVQEMISEIETHLNGSEVGINTQFLEHIDLEFYESSRWGKRIRNTSTSTLLKRYVYI